MVALTLQEIQNRVIQRVEALMRDATAANRLLLIELCGDVVGLVEHARELDRRVARVETQLLSISSRLSQG